MKDKNTSNQENQLKVYWSAFQAGDQNAFGEIFSVLHEDLIVFLLSKFSGKFCKERVRDGISEALLEVLSNPVHRQVEVDNVGAYLSKIAYYKLKNEGRKKTNTAVDSLDELSYERLNQSHLIYENVEFTLDREFYASCIDKIENSLYRKILHLFLLENFTIVMIAEKLGKTVKSTNDRKNHALKQLRIIIEKE